MNKIELTLLGLFSMIYGAQAQTIEFEGMEFEISKVKASIEDLNGEEVLKVERDLEALPFAYPDFKFQKLRSPEFQGKYETYADVGLDEWITFRIEFRDEKAYLYLNDQEAAAFVVSELLGNSRSGSIGPWVDIGTIGYFKDLNIKE